MLAKSLLLKDFRNYKECRVDFDDGINIIYGSNAQGKTNLLEGLFFLAATRSFRAGRDKDLVRFGEEHFELQLDFLSQDRPMNIKIKGGTGRKEININGIRQRKNTDVLGIFNSVLFAPEHLNLIKSGPAERRRFLDLSLSQLKPAYFNALIEYNHILSQKNALLKSIYTQGRKCDTLDIWNQKLSGIGTYIIKERELYCRTLEAEAAYAHKDISSGTESLEIKYMPSPEGILDSQDMQGYFYNETLNNQKRETESGLCLIGPHRDNFDVIINGRDARVYCSQGQQRSAVLSLKSAECEMFNKAFCEYPVLLLDDILSELDEKRQEYIIGSIKGKQVIITCCEKEKFKALSCGKLIQVEGGKLFEKSLLR